MKQKVAIIGSGLAGLSSALYLTSDKSYTIDIYEKNNYTGGKLGEILYDGFRFDTGPSVVTMPDVIKDLFTHLGENIDDYIKFCKINPINRNYFSDGTSIDSLQNISDFKKELSKFNNIASENYESYIDRIKGIYNKTADIFLFSQLHEIKHLIKSKQIPNLLDFAKIDAFKTMHQINSKYFPDGKIQQIFDRYATYNGSSPFLAPGTLNLIAYVELILGSYYIDNGISTLPKSLTEIANKKGIKIHLNSEVDEIIIENNIAKSIKVNGEIINYDIIISNSDVVYTHNNLIKGYEKEKEKLLNLEPSLSGMVFLWGIKGNNEKLVHHNVFYSQDYRKEFDDIFSKKTAPDDPTIYIAITSKSNESHAPANCENWFVLLNMPYLDNQDWNLLSEKMRNAVIKKLKYHGINISDKILFEKIFTPDDLYKMYYSNKGSIYGISSNSMMTAFKRQANRSGRIKNLYFAGGSSHPGGGIPLVILSGKHVSEIIKRKSIN